MLGDAYTRARHRARPWVRAARRLARREVTIDQLSFGRSVSMSQFGEDVILADLFGAQRSGFYVDVGALHPCNGSNTYDLWRRGWHGINIDPVPDQLALFDQFRPDDINLGCAVGGKDAWVDFVVDGSFSSLSDTYRTPPERRTQDTIRVPMRKLVDILDDHVPAGRRIDLLDVDCEGADAAVLRSNDWARYQPRVVLAEQLARTAEVELDPFKVLEENGYRLHCLLHLTGVWLAPDWSGDG